MAPNAVSAVTLVTAAPVIGVFAAVTGQWRVAVTVLAGIIAVWLHVLVLRFISL